MTELKEKMPKEECICGVRELEFGIKRGRDSLEG